MKIYLDIFLHKRNKRKENNLESAKSKMNISNHHNPAFLDYNFIDEPIS
jgi:hypothetical protein